MLLYLSSRSGRSGGLRYFVERENSRRGGSAYTLGGRDAGNTRLLTVEQYDPDLNTWTAVAPMSTARYTHAAAVLGGHLYALGGL